MDFADTRISLVNADLTGLPPTTVHFGEYETLADDGAALGRRLADFGITSEVHRCPKAGTPSSSAPDAYPRPTGPSSRWVSG
ncbi:alpha/beta hydrolase [Streptomyces anulatus]|uniref:alpha/beta hydrolase n=1 Tax=Streptomyces TaxID=1883 RepID=UPI00210D1A57|nr:MULTISPECIES: alpha/beta hydrolase fold domain-containing protein [unclassified Streptomyces]MDQ0700349.1 acetyl esterase/lipase [Streptomyces sp. W4I9-2]MDX3489550.1 alpha/beta hydrolase fold domain-containing protein [Streptomyces sp. ID05-18]